MPDLLLEDGVAGVLIDAALPFDGPQGVIQIADDEHWPIRLIEGEFLFDGNCCILAENSMVSLSPLNSYEIDYYYCRSAIVVTVDAADPSPLLASFTAYAQMMAVLVLGKVCGELNYSVTGYIDQVEPPQIFACGVAGFPAPGGGFYILVDLARVSLPLHVWMTLTVGEDSRSGYILIRKLD